MNILSPPTKLEELEKKREQLDSQFVLALIGLAICAMFACNGLFTLFSSYDFGQPRLFSWGSLVVGFGCMPLMLLRVLKVGHAVSGFEWVGADTGKVIQEEAQDSHVRAYCEAVSKQGRMLTTGEAFMLLERFSDRDAIDKVMRSLPRRSMFEWLFSRYI
jgi:hypothetical protein